MSDASSIYFYTNQGAGLFTQTSTISTGVATGMSIGTDLNNDGYRDIVATSSSSGRVYLNDGSNNFSLQDTLAISTNAFATVTDLDRDGVSDIVYTNFGTGNYVIYQGNGNGTFAQRLTTTTASTSYLSADFNQDGEIDYATYTSATGTIRTHQW